MSVEENRQQLANIKIAICELLAQLCERLYVALEQGDWGGACSTLWCTRGHAEVLVAWAETMQDLDDYGLVPEAIPLPIDHRWFQAILDTDDPLAWYERALEDQLGPRQIRRAAGVTVKAPSRDLAKCPAELVRRDGGQLLFNVPLGEPLPELPREVELVVRRRKDV